MSPRMTTTLLCMFLLFGLTSSAEAVRFEGAGVRVGTAAVFTDFEFAGVSALDAEAVWGPSIGGFIHWKWSRRSVVGVVIGADYVEKGYEGRRSLPIDGGGADIAVSARYLSVPVLARLRFYEDEARVYAVVGPSFEFQIDADDDPLLSGFRSSALAANIGLGVEIAIADPLELQFEMRYCADLTDSWDGDAALNVDSARNRMLMLTGGLRF